MKSDDIKCDGRLYLCRCKICGDPISMYDVRSIFPICDKCCADLGEIVMAKREKEISEEITQERSEMGVRV